MSRLILIRHGESESNKDKSILATKPDYLIGLTELGRKQAQKAGKKLQKLSPRPRVIVSPFLRAKQTFEEISKAYKKKLYPVEDVRVREQDIGNWITNVSEIHRERENHSRFFYRFPNGESCADVFVRVKQFLLDLEDSDGDTIIVAHAATMKVFQMIVKGLTVEQFELLPKPKNCEIIVL